MAYDNGTSEAVLGRLSLVRMGRYAQVLSIVKERQVEVAVAPMEILQEVLDEPNGMQHLEAIYEGQHRIRTREGEDEPSKSSSSSEKQ